MILLTYIIINYYTTIIIIVDKNKVFFQRLFIYFLKMPKLIIYILPFL